VDGQPSVWHSEGQLPKTVVKTVVISSPGTISANGTWPISYSQSWWAAVDSNHVPPRYQYGAQCQVVPSPELRVRTWPCSRRRYCEPKPAIAVGALAGTLMFGVTTYVPLWVQEVQGGSPPYDAGRWVRCRLAGR
jgi:hypothetical protein